jgi:uncharacterized protein (TIGR02147 family)
MKIYEYSDYRIFLRDRFEELKKCDGLTYRGFSALAGFSSPNFMQLVISGKRNLSIEGSRKVANGFSLNAKEAGFFELLVQANQSTDMHEKSRLTDKLMKVKGSALPKQGNIPNYDYYKFWYNIPIREAFLVAGAANKSVKDIANAFWSKLSKSEVKQALEILVKLKMLKKDSKGKLKIATTETLEASDFITNSLIGNFHIQMLELGKRSVVEVKREEREIGAVTISLSRAGFEQMRALIKEFRSKALSIGERDTDKKDVYQIGFQLFPLTVGLSEEK